MFVCVLRLFTVERRLTHVNLMGWLLGDVLQTADDAAEVCEEPSVGVEEMYPELLVEDTPAGATDTVTTTDCPQTRDVDDDDPNDWDLKRFAKHFSEGKGPTVQYGGSSSSASGGAPPPLPPPPDAPADQPERRTRRKKDDDPPEPWGPFSISKIKVKGVWTAYGANCLLHTNKIDKQHLTCTRWVTGTDDEARRRAMQWLVAGASIDEDEDPQARERHVPILFELIMSDPLLLTRTDRRTDGRPVLMH